MKNIFLDDLNPWMQYVLAHSTHSETFKDLLGGGLFSFIQLLLTFVVDRFCDLLNFQIRVSTRGLQLKREIINKDRADGSGIYHVNSPVLALCTDVFNKFRISPSPQYRKYSRFAAERKMFSPIFSMGFRTIVRLTL